MYFIHFITLIQVFYYFFLSRLTELTTNMGISPLPVDIDALILYSKQLKSLEFNLGYKEPTSPDGEFSDMSVLLNISFSHSSSKYLKIRCRRPTLIVSKADFEKLISFCSKHFNLSVRSILARSPDSFVPHLLAQNNKATTLRNLSLQLRFSMEDILSVFAQTFQNLNHLDVSWLSDVNLESLLKFKVKSSFILF